MKTSREFGFGAAAVVLAAVVLRTWSAGHWSWMLDDWVYMERAHSMPLLDFLFQNYNGHVMPGEFLIVWLTTSMLPLSHSVAVVVTVLGTAGATVVWAFALRELGGARIRMLFPLLLISLSPLLVQATIWWAAALQAVSMQAGLGGCVYFAVRLARRGERRDRIGLLVTFLATALMWEKALLLAIPVCATLAYLAPRERPDRYRRLVREVTWLGLVAAAYTAFYVAVIHRPSTALTPVAFQMRPLSVVARSFGDLVGQLLAPGLLGGPWGTLPTAAHVTARQDPVQVAVTCAVLVVAVVLSWRLCRSAWLPLAMVVTYAVASWGLIVLSNRLDVFWLTKVGYERYASDTFTVMCLALALFLAPEARRATEAPRGRAMSVVLAASPGVSAALVLALAGSLAIADVTAVRRIGTSPARDWVRHVTADVDRLAPVSVYDAVAPDDVLFGPFWGDRARLSRMLSPLGDEVRFDQPARHLYVVTKQGRLRPAVIGTAIRSRPGPQPSCGYALAPGVTLDVPMTGALYAYRWGLQINAFSGAPGSVTVEVDGRLVHFPIDRGLNAPQAVFVGTARHVRLTADSAREVICVTDVVIGSVGAATTP